MNKSDVAPREQRSLGRVGLRAKWHRLQKGTCPSIPVFSRKSHWKRCCPSARACSRFAIASGPQDANREQTGNGWHKRHPWSRRVLTVSPASVSPFPIPCSVAWAWLLSSGNRQRSAACLLWGAWGQNSPARDLAQNVLKAFPQIVGFNFNKSYLVALRTVAMGEGNVMP